MPLRPLIIANPDKHLSGGTRRSFEILLRAKDVGMDPIIIVDYPDTAPLNEVETLSRFYEVYLLRKHDAFRILRSFLYHGRAYYSIAKDVYSIVRNLVGEQVDIIVSHGENHHLVLSAAIASVFMKSRWTAVLQSLTVGTTFEYPLTKLTINSIKKTIPLVVSASIPFMMRAMGLALRYRLLDPPLGIDHSTATRTRPSDEEFDAAYYARLTPDKGAYDIVKIWKLIVRKYPKCRLAVAGRFDSIKTRNTFFKMLKELNLTENIQYLGYVYYDKIYSLIKSCKVVVYPSYLDAFPLAVLEALACGVPVIAYNIPGIALNYSRTKAVLRVPVGHIQAMANRVMEFVEGVENAKELRCDALKFASYYTWERACEAEYEAYMRLLDRG